MCNTSRHEAFLSKDGKDLTIRITFQGCVICLHTIIFIDLFKIERRPLRSNIYACSNFLPNSYPLLYKTMLIFHIHMKGSKVAYHVFLCE